MKVFHLGIHNFSFYFKKTFYKVLRKAGECMFKKKKARASRALRRALHPGHIWISPSLIVPLDFIANITNN